jgi:hypothetical protein
MTVDFFFSLETLIMKDTMSNVYEHSLLMKRSHCYINQRHYCSYSIRLGKITVAHEV